MEKPEWKPTHQHKEGGQYQFLHRCIWKDEKTGMWIPAVAYLSMNSDICVTANARWVKWFTPIEEVD